MRPVSISDFKAAVAFSGGNADDHSASVQHYDSCSDSDDEEDEVFATAR